MAKYDEHYFYQTEKTNQDIKDLLTEDEQLLWQGKPHKTSFIFSSIFKMMPIALLWLGFDSFFIVTLIGTGAINGMETGIILFLVGFFALHLLPVWIWIKNIVTASFQHKNLEYAFTNKRIIIKSGVIGIDFQNIYYSSISSVNLRVGLIDRIFKVGDIYILSDRKAQVLFDISNPYIITTKLQEIVNDIKTDVYFPNALRPSENQGYNTKYKDK